MFVYSPDIGVRIQLSGFLMITRIKLALIVLITAFLAFSAKEKEATPIGVQESIQLFRADAPKFASSTTLLRQAILSINRNNPETIKNALQALADSRVAYKRIESMMEYFFVHSARIYNRAAKTEIEEPYLDYQAPMGLQYMEALLHEPDPFSKKKELLEQITILEHAAKDLTSLLYQFKPSDSQILESLRLELIRIMTLGITGYDAPLLKTAITESYEVLLHIQKALNPYMRLSAKPSDSLSYYLKSTLQFLKQNPNFDTFDRLSFFTNHTLPLQTHLGKMISRSGFQLNTSGVLNYDADHLFKAEAFKGKFLDPKTTRSEIALGEKLFSEAALSGNGQISCATCHPPGRFFQDGLAKSVGFDGSTPVSRNAPSLLYASLQHSQFWDGREKTLEQQVGTVTHDSLEMNGKIEVTIGRLAKAKAYRKWFKRAYSKNGTPVITEANIQKAIASYVRTLKPFHSDFDRYIAGDMTALDSRQIRGFNLFMGKAQCGTCHFAPLFNGLVPPLYQLTEFEVLGTTLTENLSKPEKDTDDGRIRVRPIKFYEGAFKTPTVRNSAVTGPYMHNGAFTSLDSLMEFYNRGGGAGLGLDLPYQTLSPNSLNLSEEEKKDVISFLNALTDRMEVNK